MRIKTQAWVFAFSLPLLLGSWACDTTFPDDVVGGRIQGTVTYTGDVHVGLGHPSVTIVAFATWPPGGPPHGSHMLEFPEGLDRGLNFEISNLEDHSYYLTAQLVDLATDPEKALAAGGHPNFCDFGHTPILVTRDQIAAGIDIRLYDGGGQQDPCVDPTQDVNPEPGKAALVVTVVGPGLVGLPGPDDKLSVALFPLWPPVGAPIGFTQLLGTAGAFPARFVDNRVSPEPLTVMVCLDVGNNNMLCDGASDISVVHADGDPIDFQEGVARAIEVNLVTGETKEVDIE